MSTEQKKAEAFRQAALKFAQAVEGKLGKELKLKDADITQKSKQKSSIFSIGKKQQIGSEMRESRGMAYMAEFTDEIWNLRIQSIKDKKNYLKGHGIDPIFWVRKSLLFIRENLGTLENPASVEENLVFQLDLDNEQVDYEGVVHCIKYIMSKLDSDWIQVVGTKIAWEMRVQLEGYVSWAQELSFKRKAALLPIEDLKTRYTQSTEMIKVGMRKWIDLSIIAKLDKLSKSKQWESDKDVAIARAFVAKLRSYCNGMDENLHVNPVEYYVGVKTVIQDFFDANKGKSKILDEFLCQLLAEVVFSPTIIRRIEVVSEVYLAKQEWKRVQQ